MVSPRGLEPLTCGLGNRGRDSARDIEETTSDSPTALHVARHVPEFGNARPPAPLDGTPDPDLTAVIRAWPGLPPHVREAITVLVGSDDEVRKKRRERTRG